MAGNKAPSAGTKVTSGDVNRNEATGAVDRDSLAAESIASKGGFGENRDVHIVEKSASASAGAGGNEKPDAAGATATASNGADAPSYASAQHNIRDPNPPHGRNLTEGGWDESKAEDGVQKAFAAEVGSIDDPARLAEKKAVAGKQSVTAPGRETAADGTGQGGFEKLQTDVEA